jgi:hypothetical protein
VLPDHSVKHGVQDWESDFSAEPVWRQERTVDPLLGAFLLSSLMRMRKMITS